MSKQSRLFWLAIVGATMLAATACNKKDPKRSGGKDPAVKPGSQATMGAMGTGGAKAGMGTVVAKGNGGMSAKGMSAKGGAVATTAAAMPLPGDKAGSPHLFKGWKWKTRSLARKAKAAIDAKAYPKAQALLTKAIALQPELVELHYRRAYVRALAGDAPGSFKDLAVPMFANFVHYSDRAIKDDDLALLKDTKNAEEWGKLLAAAKAETLKAWPRAFLFIGSRGRAVKAKQSSQMKGSQEVYGFIPETGRYVGITSGAPGQALGFLRFKQLVIVVRASRYRRGEYGQPVFADARVDVISLTSGEVLHTFSARKEPEPVEAPETKPTKPGEKAKPEEAEEKPGEIAIKLRIRRGGLLRVQFFAANKAGAEDTTGDLDHFVVLGENSVNKDEAAIAKERKRRGYGFKWLRINHCNGGRATVTWPKKVKSDGGTFTLDGKAVTFPCAGMLWLTPDKKRAIFKPYRYCKRKTQQTGLYLVDGDGKLSQLMTENNTWAGNWISNDRFLAQFGYKLRLIDLAPGAANKLIKMTPYEGFLRIHVPRTHKGCKK